MVQECFLVVCQGQQGGIEWRNSDFRRDIALRIAHGGACEIQGGYQRISYIQIRVGTYLESELPRRWAVGM